MYPNPYSFDAETWQSIRNSKLSDMQMSPSKWGIERAVSSLIDLISGPQATTSFNHRGYTVVLSGPWGVGKTFSSWAIYNALEEHLELAASGSSPLICIYHSFLPIGNITESIAGFMTAIAQRLDDEGLINIHNETRQIILESAPIQEGFNLSANLGLIGFSKKLTARRLVLHEGILEKKFGVLAKKNRTLILIFDDLDRLRPAEIVVAMRLIERLRSLPRVLIILPVSVSIIQNAFQADLKLNSSDAAGFLRKLTDLKIVLSNTYEELFASFKSTFSAELNQRFEEVLQPLMLSLAELSWQLLIHNLVIEQANIKFHDDGKSGDSAEAIFGGEASGYLQKLAALLASANNSREYPVRLHADNQTLIGLGERYGHLAQLRDYPEPAMKQLRQLLSLDNVLLPVVTDQSIIAQLRSGANVDIEAGPAPSTAPLLQTVLLPLLKSSHKERLLVDRYKHRDIKALGQHIAASMVIDITTIGPQDILREIYIVVRENYLQFRFDADTSSWDSTLTS